MDNEELIAEIVAEYLNNDPSVESNAEILKDIAEKFEISPNKVRVILQKEEVYIQRKVEDSPSKTSKTSSTGGTKRVSKESAIKELREAIISLGKEVDEDILGKLTGKAAVYFTSVIKQD